MIAEGSKAVYAGEDQTIGQGSLCKVLVVAAAAAHVQWLDGPRTGSVDLIETYDLSPAAPANSAVEVVAAQFDQSLEIGDPPALAIREAMDVHGEEGVLAALDNQGHLAMLAPYASEAMEHLTAHLRSDDVLAGLLVGLDDFEQELVLSRLAANLLDTEEEQRDMTASATEHVLTPGERKTCRGRLKHVFRRETRPWTADPHTGFQEERHICQRCRGILFDWDGPFDPKVQPKAMTLHEMIKKATRI